MGKHSEALSLTWKIAAAEARKAKAAGIFPSHLFLGIISLGKLSGNDFTAAPTIPIEIENLESVWKKFELDPTKVRREVRAWMILATPHAAQQEVMHRTPTSKAVFRLAQRLCDNMQCARVEVSHLLAALLDYRDEELAHILDDVGLPDEKINRLRRALTADRNGQHEPILSVSPEPRPVEPPPTLAAPEPVEELPPSMGSITPTAPSSPPSLPSQAVIHYPSAAPSPETIALPTVAHAPALGDVGLMRELVRLFTTESNVDRLLERIPELVVRMMPSATRSAILILDEGSKRLLHKGSYPSDGVYVSDAMARAAMEAESYRSFEETNKHGGSIVGFVQALYVKLRWKNHCFGLLAFSHPKHGSRFGEADILLAEMVSDLIAMAIGQSVTQHRVNKQMELTLRLFASRFSPRTRAELLARAESDNLLSAQHSPVTILIADIRGFTRLSSQLEPRRLSDLLNEYFPPIVDAIFEHDGSIERFAGDCVFAVFGSPRLDPKIDADHPFNAVRAALHIRDAIQRITEVRKRRKQEVCGFGIGLDTGPVLHGFIGTAERMEFAVVGDPANLASRYCAGAGEGEILISPQLQQFVWNMARTSKVEIATKHEGTIPAYKLLELKEEKPLEHP